MEFQAEGRLLVDMGQEIMLVGDDAAPAATLTKNTFQASDGNTLSYWLYTPENAVPGMPMLLYPMAEPDGDDLEQVMRRFPELPSGRPAGRGPRLYRHAPAPGGPGRSGRMPSGIWRPRWRCSFRLTPPESV